MKSVLFDDEDIHPQIQPGFITIFILVESEIYVNTIQIKIDPQIPFQQFCKIVKDMVFSQILNKAFLVEIVFLKKNLEIRENDQTTLEELRFINGDQLKVKLRLKGG